MNTTTHSNAQRYILILVLPASVAFIAGCMKRAPSILEPLEPRQMLAAQAYDWNSVTIKANGFIDGIVYHPAQPNLVYIHTDMGGAYRWDEPLGRWSPLNDWSRWNDWPAQNLGVETMAVDPTDPNRVYMAAGTYMSPTAILRSTDQGRTWLRTDVNGINSNGNGSARNAGERMVVDPNSPNLLYYGTRDDGLWKSIDYGATWNNVASFPTIGDDSGVVEADTGIVWVLFDKSSATPGNATQVIYAGVAHYAGGANRIYRSTDGGGTWQAISGGQPTTANFFPQRAAISPDGGTLYLTYGFSTDYPGPWGISGGWVYKVTNPAQAAPTWSNISPVVAGYGFSAVAIDPVAPNTVYVSELGNYNPADRIWRSTTSGGSWSAIAPNSNRDDSSAPYASSLGVHWLGDLQIDPFNRDVAMFTTGYGLYRTDNLTGGSPQWTFFNEGFEQSAALELASPNTGSVHLLSAIGDRDGYRHDDFSHSPALGRHGQNNALARGTSDDIDVAFNDANYSVRVLRSSPWVQYSNNNGVTWAWFGSTNSAGSTSGGGNIAISADGTKVVYEPGGSGQVRFSTRSGSAWGSWTNPTTNRPANGAKIVADLVGAQTFYAYVATTVSRSIDGGANWTVMTSSAPSGGEWIRAVPGQAGHLLMSRRDNGLWRTTNGGASWTRINPSAVTTANQVGVGAGPTPGSYPSIFVGGTVNGLTGFHRSDDQGATWVSISDLSHQFGWVTVIQGDPRVHGRLYVGSNGRGILYGDIDDGPDALPSGWSSADIGSPASAGAAGESGGTFELIGGGSGVTETFDQFRFAYRQLTGDGSITARVVDLPRGAPGSYSAKAGVMIRDTLAANSSNAFVALTPGSVGGVVFQSRLANGAATTTLAGATTGVWPPCWVRLTRAGDEFTAYRSGDGVNWTPLGSPQTIAMGASVYIGLATTTGNNTQVGISQFEQVSTSLTQPPVVHASAGNDRIALIRNGALIDYFLDGVLQYSFNDDPLAPLLLDGGGGEDDIALDGVAVRLAQSTQIVTAISIVNSASLDLAGGTLIVRNGDAGSWDGSAYTGLTGLVARARQNNWADPGITSSLAAASGGRAAVAISRSGNDVVLRYTYDGDANLDGKINIDDYGRIDANIAQSGIVFGYAQGDFNLDGKINIDDYGIIDGNLNQQDEIL